jgi:hypothetical protein
MEATYTAYEVLFQEKPCYFLDMPAEIRNRIYHYAMTSTTSVLELRMPPTQKTTQLNVTARQYQPTTSALLQAKRGISRPILMSGSGDGLDVEFNQLKFVNKQLYQETAGIEIQSNDIVVTHQWTHEELVGLQLVKFINHLSLLVRPWLAGCTFFMKDLRCMAIRKFGRHRGTDGISQIVRTDYCSMAVCATYAPLLLTESDDENSSICVGELTFDGTVFAYFTKAGKLRPVLPAIEAHARFLYRHGRG